MAEMKDFDIWTALTYAWREGYNAGVTDADDFYEGEEHYNPYGHRTTAEKYRQFGEWIVSTTV